MLKVLMDDVKKETACEVDIKFGQCKDGYDSLQLLISVCNNHKSLKSRIEDDPRYCAEDYKVAIVEGTISLFEAEELQKELKEANSLTNTSIYYHNSKFVLDYDNTYF